MKKSTVYIGKGEFCGHLAPLLSVLLQLVGIMHRYMRVRVLHSQPSTDTLCCCPNVASVVSANILC